MSTLYIRNSDGDFVEIPSLKGDPGESGVRIDNEEPTDPFVNVWIDPDGEPDGEIPEPYVLPVASADTLGGVKVGEGLQMDGDVLRVKSEGVYELIETITLDEEMAVSRTQEPDGTPYAFVDIFLKIKVLNAALPDVVRFIFYCNGIAVARTYLSPQASTGNYYASCIVKIENGYWRSGWDVWQTNSSIVNSLRTSNDIEYGLKYAANSYPCVDWINAGVLPAGTTIEIYGVRA